MIEFLYDYSAARAKVREGSWRRYVGKVTKVVGLTVEVSGVRASIGELCLIGEGRQQVRAEVVGFNGDRLHLFALAPLEGVSAGSKVFALRRRLSVKVGDNLLGQVLDGLGRPLHGELPPGRTRDCSLDQAPPSPMQRDRVSKTLATGIKALDLFLTMGHGQRLGIFAGSGVGKSTMLGMIARGSSADFNVIALVGERGREVRDFLERDLGEEGLKRSVVIAATSDQPALMRIKAALTATAVAEHFRDQGKSVLLLMDSVTRFAMAQREIGLAVGEPPTTRGYTPSVFAALPKLLERSGNGKGGSITALYTVLVEGDDMNEPITDAVRGILDGHVVLSRRLAERNHYPSIDILQSVSRLASELCGREHSAIAARARSIMATYRQNEDLISIGAYVKGSNADIDEAVAKYPQLMELLAQATDERCNLSETLEQLKNIVTR